MSGKKIFLICIVLVIVGVVLGWLLYGGSSLISPVTQPIGTKSTQSAPAEQPGFCCSVAGKSCTALQSPVACFRAGGLVFDTDRAGCDTYCLSQSR